MRARLLIAGLFLALGPLAGAGDGHLARYRMVTPTGQHVFDIIVVVPQNYGFIASMRVEGDAHADLPDLLEENRRQARLFTGITLNYAVEVYRHWGLLTPESQAAMEKELGEIREMRWPLIAFVPPFSDGPILHMVTMAPSDRTLRPTPALNRIYRSGFEGPQLEIPREQVAVIAKGENVPFYRSHKIGAGVDPAMTLFLSLLPRAAGRFVEAKLFVSNPEYSLKLSKAVSDMVLTLGLHRYSDETLPEWLRPKMIEAVENPAVYEIVDEFLEAAYGTPWESRARALRQYWRKMVLEMPVENVCVLGEATQESRLRLYSRIYGVDAREIFADADYGGEPTGLFQMPLSLFESVPGERLRRLEGYTGYEGSQLLPSLTGLRGKPNCLQIMSTAFRWKWISENPELVSF